MKTRAKKPAETVPVPQSAEEAATALAVIGAAQRGIALQKAALDETVARAKAEAEAACQPLLADIERRTRGLEIWASANREALARGKTITLPTGTLAWRARPPSVAIRGVDMVIDTCRSLGLERFLRVRTEVNKEAMLAEPAVAEKISGVSIGSAGEQFVAEPTEAPALAPAVAP